MAYQQSLPNNPNILPLVNNFEAMALGEQETCAVLNANPARREQSAFVESGREPLANAAYHTTDRSMPAALIAAVPDLVGTNFADPCYGRGCLADALEGLGLRCTFKSDIAPAGPDVLARDLLALEALPEGTQGIITNLPSHGDGSLSTALARRALSLIRPGGYLALLTRLEWPTGASRRDLTQHPALAAMCIPTWRPSWGFAPPAGKRVAPVHNYCWLVWRPGRSPGRPEVIVLGRDALEATP